MVKKKFNQELFESELKRFQLLKEYSFYGKSMDEVDDYNKNKDNILLDEDDEEIEDDSFGTEEENPAPEDQPIDTSANPLPAVPSTDIQPELPPAAPVEDTQELDVTELVTKSDEAKASADMATSKMDELMGKFDQITQHLEKMDGISKKIEDLEVEIERRNPTPDEKLEMVSFNSYPYNIKLSDYWAEKTGQYDVLGKNGKEEVEKEYILTTDDIDDEYSESDIKNTFTDYGNEEEKDNTFKYGR